MKIGLTGGIGSGKSTVAAILREYGLEVIDADQVAREVVRPGHPSLQRLVHAFGDGILLPDGCLNRKALAQEAFGSAAKKTVLDRITHGEIYAIIVRRLQQAKTDPVFADVPLLFESGINREMDRVWVVTARLEDRVRRVAARDGITPIQVKQRIDRQMSDAEKCAAADVVIENTGSKEELREQIRRRLQEEDVELHRQTEKNLE